MKTVRSVGFHDNVPQVEKTSGVMSHTLQPGLQQLKAPSPPIEQRHRHNFIVDENSIGFPVHSETPNPINGPSCLLEQFIQTKIAPSAIRGNKIVVGLP